MRNIDKGNNSIDNFPLFLSCIFNNQWNPYSSLIKLFVMRDEIVFSKIIPMIRSKNDERVIIEF